MKKEEYDSFIDKKQFPMIGNLSKDKDKLYSSKRTLTIEGDRYLDHHRFNNVPFLPGVMGLEFFAELVKYLQPEREIWKFVNVEFQSAIRLKDDQPKEIQTDIKFNINSADAVITSQVMKDGKLTNDSKLHFKSEIVFGSKGVEKIKLPSLKKMPLLREQFIYEILPHGPLLQVLTEINHIEENMLAILKVKKKQLMSWKHKEFLINPLSIEACFQALGLMDFIDCGRAGLPSKIGELIFYKTKSEPYFIVGQKKGDVEKGGLFDFQLVSKKGEVVVKAIDFQTVEINLGETTNIFERIRSHQIRMLFKIPKLAWLEVVSNNLLRDKLSREPEFIGAFLHPDEIKEFDKLAKDEQKKVVPELYAQKRALRIVTRGANMCDLKIELNEKGQSICQHKNKTIYLTTKRIENYALAMASYGKKVDIELNQKEELLKKIIEKVKTK
ncbi:MAG: polyketide synthase dehydratase domain-containing protein [Candidatus Heimdallarchaeota archaeon]